MYFNSHLWLSVLRESLRADFFGPLTAMINKRKGKKGVCGSEKEREKKEKKTQKKGQKKEISLAPWKVGGKKKTKRGGGGVVVREKMFSSSSFFFSFEKEN